MLFSVLRASFFFGALIDVVQSAESVETLKAVAKTSNEEYPNDQCGYWYQTAGYEAYKEKRDACVWGDKIMAKDFFGESFHTGQTWDGRPVRLTWTSPLEQDIYVQECMFEDPDPRRAGEFWKIRRFGPFFSDGKHNHGKALWQQTKWHERFTKRYMTGRVFARYDAKTGELLGSPPLHIHHEHVGYSEGLPDFVPLLSSFKVNRLAASHGEQYGLHDDGVIMNVFKTLPHGLGKPMSYYTYDNKLADTRDEGATPIEFFQEVGFRTTAVKQREVYHMTRFNVGSLFKNFNLDVPEDKPSMFWSTWRMPASGEFITNWIHTHGLEDVIIFKGDPATFGLKDHYAKPDIWTMKTINSIESVKQDLTQRAKNVGISWCNGEAQFEDVNFPEYDHPGVETRITKVCCLPWSFKEGDVVAMVGFFDGRKDRDPLHQHFLFRGEYFLENEKTVAPKKKEALLMQNLQFCGEDPDTCVKTVTLGLKLSAVLFYGGNLPTDTMFARTVGWCVVVLVFGILVFLTGLLARCVLKKCGWWPLEIRKCCAPKGEYSSLDQEDRIECQRFI